MIHEDIFESRSLGNICVYIHLSNINVKEDFSNQRNKIIKQLQRKQLHCLNHAINV